jgi:tetratricopeptide (TPR) repeat protein
MKQTHHGYFACAFAAALMSMASDVYAQSKLWSQTAPDDAHQVQLAYRAQVSLGDDTLTTALGSQRDRSIAIAGFNAAINNYRAAIKLQPNWPEAYAHLGDAIHVFVEGCDRSSSRGIEKWCNKGFALNKTLAREGVAALVKFIELAPLDARSDQCLRSAAVLATKLNTVDDLRVAEAMYRKQLDRNDESPGSRVELANLAEVLMMMNRLDESIAMYVAALSVGGDASEVLGLAVALDRHGQAVQARALVRTISDTSLEHWQRLVAEGSVFYVPAGEEHYYRALVNESQGNGSFATEEYNLFLASGAQPQFADRAKSNIERIRRGPRTKAPSGEVTP